MKRAMIPGEISVYLGHRKIWRRFLDEGQEFALIMEDDFYIPDDSLFLQAIEDAVSVSSHWDIVKLFDFRPKNPIQRWRVNRTDFVMYKYPPAGGVAYLIRVAAAERLLQQRFIYRPIDEDWSHPWENNLRILSVASSPVSEIATALGGSLLETERRNMKADDRNWLRARYGNILSFQKNIRSVLWNRKTANSLLPSCYKTSRSGPTF